MPANPFEHFSSPMSEKIEELIREKEKQLEELVKQKQDEDIKSKTLPLEP